MWDAGNDFDVVIKVFLQSADIVVQTEDQSDCYGVLHLGESVCKYIHSRQETLKD